MIEVMTKIKDLTTVDSFFTKSLQTSQTTQMLDIVKQTEIMKPEHSKFLALPNVQKHLADVVSKTWIWRTKGQKASILSDEYHPTTHGKFQQAMLEQKVFFGEAVRLARDFELLKVKVRKQLIERDRKVRDLKSLTDEFDILALEAEIDEANINLKYSQVELNECQTSMDFRMREIIDWQEIQEHLMAELAKEGFTEEQMFNKEAGEVEYQFFWGLNHFEGIHATSDGSERVNLIALVKHGINQAIGAGMFLSFLPRCNQRQLKYIKDLGYELPKEYAV
jgi:hypothetical protein